MNRRFRLDKNGGKRGCSLYLWAIIAALQCLQCMPSAAVGQAELSASTREQIRILQEEKRSRTPVQRKLDSQLLYGLHESQKGRASANVVTLRATLSPERDGRILVDMQAEVSPALLQFIQANGGTVLSSFERYKAIRALLPLAKIETVAAQQAVHSIRPADQAA